VTLAVETLLTVDAIDALRDDWETLRLADPDRSPFVSYEWYRCCLEDSEGAEPMVLAVRANGRLVGIAPLARRLLPGRWGSTRTVEFLRCRETSHADLVVDPALREEVLVAVCGRLLDERPRIWDLLSLGPWPERSPNAIVAQRLLRERGARWTERTASLVPVVRIDRDWEAYWGTRTYLFRKSRRGIQNRMRKLGTVEVEAVRADDSGEGMRAFYRVADRAWKRDEGLAVTSREESKRFFACLTEAAGRRGWLLLWVLRLDGTPIAVEYNLAENGTVYALRADFDQEYRAYSPGAYLEHHILQTLFAEGYRAYHAGPGFDAYKLRWTEEVRRNVSVTVYSTHGARNRLRWVADGWALPRLRAWRARTAGPLPNRPPGGDAAEEPR
jgi:CelD/BcsL family acetyltransferase involved in cellulose biosynthesis